MKTTAILNALCWIILTITLSTPTFGQTSSSDFSDLFNSVKSSVHAADKEKYTVQLLQQDESKNPSNDFLLDAIIQMVATSFAEEKSFEKAIQWTSKIKDLQMRGSTNNFIAEILIAEKNFKEAHNLLDEEILKVNKDEKSNFTPTNEQLQSTLVYGELCYAEGLYDQAAAYLHAALAVSKYVDKYKELYILSLIKSKTPTLNEDTITNIFLLPGNRSELFKDEVKAWFVEKYGNDSRYVALETKSQAAAEKLLSSKIDQMAIDLPAPNFEIKDVDGHIISLESLKGKTVILDFWATWCQPCVASFPGMKKAVLYFKNDPNVVFMFIHTAEKKGTNVREQALALINEKQYPFSIYLDLKEPKTGKSPVAEAFQVRGIPAKFVINKQGIIKFSTTGFVSEDEAVAEIKMMVERANK